MYIYGSYRAKEETTVDGTTRTVKNLIPAGSMAYAHPLLPDRPDGKLRISDADFAVQYNLGIMLEPTDSTRIGLRYLSETDLNFKDAPDVSGLLATPDYAKIDLGLKMPQQVQPTAHSVMTNGQSLLSLIATARKSGETRR